MRWRDQPILAFDTETTGLFPENGDRVIEFAGVEIWLNQDGTAGKVVPHHHLFNPAMPIPREASDISGIRDEDVAGCPPFADHAEAIHRLLSGAITVAHNYPFDQRFLTAEFARCSLAAAASPAPLAGDQWVCFDSGDMCSHHDPHPGCRYVDRFPPTSRTSADRSDLESILDDLRSGKHLDAEDTLERLLAAADRGEPT